MFGYPAGHFAAFKLNNFVLGTAVPAVKRHKLYNHVSAPALNRVRYDAPAFVSKLG